VETAAVTSYGRAWAAGVGVTAVIALSPACHRTLESGAAKPIAFMHVAVIPMDRERVLADQTVIVRQGRIAVVGASSQTAVPRDAAIIDGRGKYLMPGLADMHVHVFSPHELLSNLVWGVTTLALFSGDFETLRWRAAVAQGTLVGPTLYTSGPITDGVPPTDYDNLEVATVEEARAVVDSEKAAGYDYIKVYNNYAPSVYRAVLAEARAKGLTVVGHIVRSIGAHETLRDGQSVIAHGEEYYYTYFAYRPDTAAIPAIVVETRTAGAFVIAMLSSMPAILHMVANMDSVLQLPEARYLPPAMYEDWRPENNGYRHRADPAAFVARVRTQAAFLPVFTKALSDGHVKLLVGTDAAELNFPGYAVHDELHQLTNAGLTPYQALEAATRNAGEFIATRVRSSDRFGMVAPGMRADLILLSANPLGQIAAVDSPVGVMARGQWWTVAELRRRRDSVTAGYAALEAMGVTFDSLVKHGDARAAQSLFADAVARDPIHRPFSIYALLAPCDTLRASQPDAALAFCRMNVALYPDRFATHVGLARALRTVGDTAGARAELRTAAHLAPGNDAARRVLDSLAGQRDPSAGGRGRS